MPVRTGSKIATFVNLAVKEKTVHGLHGKLIVFIVKPFVFFVLKRNKLRRICTKKIGTQMTQI
jgi:hypothetical protein